MKGWWPTVWMIAAMVGFNIGVRLPLPWSDILVWPSFAVALVILGWCMWNSLRRR